MVKIRSISPRKEFMLENLDEGTSFLHRLRYLFNHHSFVNYVMVKDEDRHHLLRYVTLNQPYDNPFHFSIIFRPVHYNLDIIPSILEHKWISLNHLPYSAKDLARLFNIPSIKSELTLKETPFCLEPVSDDNVCKGIMEASIKLGMEYHSHVVVSEGTTVLVKFTLRNMVYDVSGIKRLESPMLDPETYLGNKQSGMFTAM